MASPADTSGRKTPFACSILRAEELAPIDLLSVATSAVETVRSTVTTTRLAELSTYQAMPRTPDSCTALLAAASRASLEWPAVAGAAAGWSSAAVVMRPAAATSSRLVLLAGARDFCVTVPPGHVNAPTTER